MNTLLQHRASLSSSPSLTQRALPCGMAMSCWMTPAGPLPVSGVQLYWLAWEAARRSVEMRETARRIAASN